MSTATLLSSRDLADPQRYLLVRAVPVMDTHESDENGDIDEALLRLIARNSNARALAGDPAAITLGHGRRKSTVIVVRRDGSRVEMPGTDEEHQPRVVGWADNFRIGDYRGQVAMFVDFHIDREHAAEARTYPWRSIERVAPKVGRHDPAMNYCDRISLLRSPPARDLGVIQYALPDCPCAGKGSDPARVHYERPLCSVRHSSPSTSPTRKTMSTASLDNRVRRIAEDVAIDLFRLHYEAEAQRDQLRQLREREGVYLPDHELERLANLDPVQFATELHTVRRFYAKRGQNRILGRAVSPAELNDHRVMRLACDVATERRIGYAEAKAEVLRSMGR
jgi:hypothetical protein